MWPRRGRGGQKSPKFWARGLWMLPLTLWFSLRAPTITKFWFLFSPKSLNFVVFSTLKRRSPSFYISGITLEIRCSRWTQWSFIYLMMHSFTNAWQQKATRCEKIMQKACQIINLIILIWPSPSVMSRTNLYWCYVLISFRWLKYRRWNKTRSGR